MNKVYKGYPLKIQGHEFLADLIELPFHELDIILGMDWLSHHQEIVDFQLTRITFKTPKNEEIIIVGERIDFCLMSYQPPLSKNCLARCFCNA